jgi:hypothetical protein
MLQEPRGLRGAARCACPCTSRRADDEAINSARAGPHQHAAPKSIAHWAMPWLSGAWVHGCMLTCVQWCQHMRLPHTCRDPERPLPSPCCSTWALQVATAADGPALCCCIQHSDFSPRVAACCWQRDMVHYLSDLAALGAFGSAAWQIVGSWYRFRASRSKRSVQQGAFDAVGKVCGCAAGPACRKVQNHLPTRKLSGPKSQRRLRSPFVPALKIFNSPSQPLAPPL